MATPRFRRITIEAQPTIVEKQADYPTVTPRFRRLTIEARPTPYEYRYDEDVRIRRITLEAVNTVDTFTTNCD